MCWRGTRVLTTVVRSVTGLEGVEAWSRLCRRTLAKDASQEGEIGDLQWEERWKVMVSELGKGAKIPDL